MIPNIIGQKSCSHFVSVWTLIFRIFIFVYHENYVDDLEALFGYIIYHVCLSFAIKLLNENIFSAYSDWTISYPFPTQWQHVWAKDVVFFEDEAVTHRCKHFWKLPSPFFALRLVLLFIGSSTIPLHYFETFR